MPDQPIHIRAIRGLLISILVAGLTWQVFDRTRPSRYELLMSAVESGNARAVKAELTAGTDPNDLPSDEYEPMLPICAAAADGKVEIVKVLLDGGADIDSGDGWNSSPLAAAADDEHMKVMQLLIARGAAINDDGTGGSASLWQAAVEGKLQAVKFLLKHGANPNSTAEDGETLLHAVESSGQKKVAAELRRAGAK